jgi:hypothetical protein
MWDRCLLDIAASIVPTVIFWTAKRRKGPHTPVQLLAIDAITSAEAIYLCRGASAGVGIARSRGK